MGITDLRKRETMISLRVLLPILVLLPVLSGCVEYIVAEAAMRIATNIVPPVYEAAKKYVEESDSQPHVAPSQRSSTNSTSSSTPVYSGEKAVSGYSDKVLCKYAVGKSGWSTNFRKYVAEAKRRNLSLGECARLEGRIYRDPNEAIRQKQEAEAERQRVAKLEHVKKQEAERRKQAQIERDRKLEAQRQRRVEAERIRVAKLEQTKKQQAEERRQRELVRKRKIADAHEREMVPIRRKNRRSFAVIIGNRNYKGRVPTVDFAHNDADAMKRFIIDKLGYREGNVYDLRDVGFNQISAVLGSKDFHEGKLFNALRKGQSDVIVFYSGHGVPGLKDKRPYLLPVDGDPNLAEITGYSVDTLYANLAKLPARSVAVFLDACFSGESEKGMLVSSASGISVKPKMPSSKGQMTVITAAQGNQLASWDTKARHGLFTKHLLDALNGEADSKEYGNYDGKVSLSEIQNYLDEEMTYQARATWNRRQNAYVRGSADTILSTVFRVP
jgi:hypothetical protein